MFNDDNESDNYITNKESWLKIKDFIPKDKKIWSPFYCDGKMKEYFKEMDIDIIHENEDFFLNDRGDIIIDNPPYSKKKEIFKKLKELNKPFILLIPSPMLCYKYFQEYFGDELQLIIPKKRAKFTKLNSTNKNYTPPYASFFYCFKMNFEKDLYFI